MTRAISLRRHLDVNNTSGTGRVWEGVLFSNGWVAGKWLSDFPSYGWYPSLEHVKQIHGHSGSTDLVFEDMACYGNHILIEAKDTSIITDGNPYTAEGFEFIDGWIVLLHLAKYTSVYWYRNIEDLRKVIGDRAYINKDIVQTVCFEGSSIWQREKIFKVTKTGVSNV